MTFEIVFSGVPVVVAGLGRNASDASGVHYALKLRSTSEWAWNLYAFGDCKDNFCTHALI